MDDRATAPRLTRRRRLAATLALLLTAGVAQVSLPLQEAGADELSPSVLFGAYPQPRGGEDQSLALQHLETSLNRQLAVVREFLIWDDFFPSSFHVSLRDGGKLPLISVKPMRANGTRIPWAEVAGTVEGSSLHGEIVRWAERIRDYGAPVYFTFHHEPEAGANLSHGTASDYIAAWRRVVTIFRDQGASSVKFLWIMTDYSFQVSSSDRRAAFKWYPGDEWVDALAADAYNWFTCREGIVTPWRSLAQIIEPFRQFGLAHPGEEMWLAEWASVEDSAVPGRKAAWINDARQLFKQPGYAQFRGVSYFHNGTRGGTFANCQWWVDTSQSALDAFAGMAADVFYQAGSSSPPPPPPPPPPPDPANPLAVVVVGSTTLSAGDVVVAQRLAGLGYTVTVVDDAASSAGNATGATVVVISDSVSSSDVRTKFRDVDVPVVVWKPALYDDMQLTATNAWGTVTTAFVTIVDPTHPLAAGRSGSVRIATQNVKLPWGSPAPSAEVVGTVTASPASFAFRPGAALADGRLAAGCRVALAASASGFARATADALALFDRAVTFASQEC